ncbi:MAG: DUF3823 domain-containing protein [Mangrovibacterium sp.]
MKNIRYIFKISVLVFALSSCMELDDAAIPEETLQGTIIDKTTGKPFVTESGGVEIRLEELSWSDKPAPQGFPCKRDGTFFNSKIFKGQYRVTPRAGAFFAWPDKSGKVVDINGVTTLNLEVEPNLTLEMTDFQQTGNKFTVKCKIVNANSTEKILDVKVFVNNTKFVGSGSYINQGGWDPKQDVNAVWANVKDKIYEFTVENLKQDRTFYMRVGARVDDEFKKYNYTEVVEIKVP